MVGEKRRKERILKLDKYLLAGEYKTLERKTETIKMQKR